MTQIKSNKLYHDHKAQKGATTSITQLHTKSK